MNDIAEALSDIDQIVGVLRKKMRETPTVNVGRYCIGGQSHFECGTHLTQLGNQILTSCVLCGAFLKGEEWHKHINEFGYVFSPKQERDWLVSAMCKSGSDAWQQ